MLYTPLINKALIISFTAHKNQTDKNGIPYIYHPYHLAEQMDTEYEICTALLHDVIEDTNMTIQDLREEGFPDEIINAINVLTHRKNQPYTKYINNIKKNELAKKVKLADLKHNSDSTRITSLTEKDEARLRKYKNAINTLTE